MILFGNVTQGGASAPLEPTLTLGYSIQPFQGKVHKLLTWMDQVRGVIWVITGT